MYTIFKICSEGKNNLQLLNGPFWTTLMREQNLRSRLPQRTTIFWLLDFLLRNAKIRHVFSLPQYLLNLNTKLNSPGNSSHFRGVATGRGLQARAPYFQKRQKVRIYDAYADVDSVSSELKPSRKRIDAAFDRQYKSSIKLWIAFWKRTWNIQWVLKESSLTLLHLSSAFPEIDPGKVLCLAPFRTAMPLQQIIKYQRRCHHWCLCYTVSTPPLICRHLER